MHIRAPRILFECYEAICSILTLILLEPEVNSLFHQYRARPVCTSMQSDQALYCWLTTHIPKMIIDSPINVKLIIPFKKFSRLRVKKIAFVYYLFIGTSLHTLGHIADIFCAINIMFVQNEISAKLPSLISTIKIIIRAFFGNDIPTII